jgi:putative addiction module component (TIGR02574 family)
VSKTEILAELPKLPPEDLAEIQSKIEQLAIHDAVGWLDVEDPLTDAQKALIEARLDDLEKHPENTIPWSDAEARLKARFGG